MASPASSPRTNPTRTNNPREESIGSPSRNGSDLPGYNDGDEGSGDSGVIAATGPSKDAVKKLDQIIQVVLTKGPYQNHKLILLNRTSTPKRPFLYFSLAFH